jgi:hypothetical protein
MERELTGTRLGGDMLGDGKEAGEEENGGALEF